MGCSSSVHIVNEIEAPIVVNNCECLAGKFNRAEIPKELWLSRMRKFIATHISQFKHYSCRDIDIIYNKLHVYEQTATMSDNKHSQAIKILSSIFNVSPRPSPKQICEELTTMALDYCVDNKEHDFEEIVFVFSIIINSPMISFYETKY